MFSASLVKSFPYYDAWKLSPWGLIWPYNVQTGPSSNLETSYEGSILYPNFNLYPAVYPHFDIYPSQVVLLDNVPHSALGSTPFEVGTGESSTSKSISSGFLYPDIVIYPVIRTHSLTNTSRGNHKNDEFWTMPPAYPILELYPAAYPYFDLYPTFAGHLEDSGLDRVARFVKERKRTRERIAKVEHALVADGNGILYKGFAKTQNYPHLVIYPSHGSFVDSNGLSTRFELQDYPNLVIYPALHVVNKSLRLQSQDYIYPHLVIYPTTYPHILLYPEPAGQLASLVKGNVAARASRSPDSNPHYQLGYPVIHTYQSVYPHIEPYPQVTYTSSIILEQGTLRQYDSKGHKHAYPNIKPYPDLVTQAGIVSTSLKSNTLSKAEQAFDQQGDVYDMRGHVHVYPCIKPYPEALLKPKRKTHAVLHNLVFANAYRSNSSCSFLTSSSKTGLMTQPSLQLKWSLHPSVLEYPAIIPYPHSSSGTKRNSIYQGRVRQLALALETHNTSWGQSGSSKSPRQSLVTEIKRASKRLSFQRSPTAHSFGSELHSPVQPASVY